MLQKKIPLAIVFIFGVISILQYFVPHPLSQAYYDTMLKWMIGVGSMAIFLALVSFIRHHQVRLKKKEHAPYSAVALLSFLFMTLVGFIGGMGPGSVFQKMFYYVQAPLQATMFSLLSYYMASASYRAFRAKSFEATLLLITAFIVMFSVTTFGNYVPGVPKALEWIMAVPNMASKRGIAIGVSLGSIATSLKIILGIERNWLGG